MLNKLTKIFLFGRQFLRKLRECGCGFDKVRQFDGVLKKGVSSVAIHFNALAPQLSGHRSFSFRRLFASELPPDLACGSPNAVLLDEWLF